jgi:hypothetical protein
MLFTIAANELTDECRKHVSPSALDDNRTKLDFTYKNCTKINYFAMSSYEPETNESNNVIPCKYSKKETKSFSPSSNLCFHKKVWLKLLTSWYSSFRLCVCMYICHCWFVKRENFLFQPTAIKITMRVPEWSSFCLKRTSCLRQYNNAFLKDLRQLLAVRYAWWLHRNLTQHLNWAKHYR